MKPYTKTEICFRCGGSGQMIRKDKPTTCTLCFGKGTIEWQQIIKENKNMVKRFGERKEEVQQHIVDLIQEREAKRIEKK